MATPSQQLVNFIQDVYRIIKGRSFDDLVNDDGTYTDDGATLRDDTISWANMYLDELETEVDPSGQPIDWSWLRINGSELGTAVSGDFSIDAPDDIDYLLTDQNRYVQILQDGTAVSNWAVVAPDQITNVDDRVTEDMCALVGDSIVFSRVFTDEENGGSIVGDVVIQFPRMSASPLNIKVLAIVKPVLLMKLGVAKNASLPDIVQGGLSPSYAQKYNNLLQNAISREMASARGEEVARDDYSNIGGV